MNGCLARQDQGPCKAGKDGLATVPAPKLKHALRALLIKLLYRDVTREVEFPVAVFDLQARQVSRDFAIFLHAGQRLQLSCSPVFGQISGWFKRPAAPADRYRCGQDRHGWRLAAMGSFSARLPVTWQDAGGRIDIVSRLQSGIIEFLTVLG